MILYNSCQLNSTLSLFLYLLFCFNAYFLFQDLIRKANIFECKKSKFAVNIILKNLYLISTNWSLVWPFYLRNSRKHFLFLLAETKFYVLCICRNFLFKIKFSLRFTLSPNQPMLVLFGFLWDLHCLPFRPSLRNWKMK